MLHNTEGTVSRSFETQPIDDETAATVNKHNHPLQILLHAYDGLLGPS